MKQETYEVKMDAEIPFFNHVDDCIGTGRLGLALQEEYLKNLEFVQKEIGFRYIRGHGLFCRDMAIYQTYLTEEGEEREEYNFTYLDRVMDSYQRMHIKPFLELGFMPENMAKGDQTVFYWKGNVTPPKDYEKWTKLVQAVLRHLIERYGRDEVLTWPIEVWNEPNLEVFWEHADMKEYFTLFQKTILAVKEVDERFQVGGPAICGVEDEKWMKAFLHFCQEKQLPLDFVTRHHYTIGSYEKKGHYTYVKLADPKDSIKELEKTRNLMKTMLPYENMPLHITEFNTSYRPDSPIHDTNQNAAYLAYLLSRLGDAHTSYAYWTFSDVFEELGVPFTPFHGGFGLVTNRGIPKPTFWTFQFFKKLQGTCRCKSDTVLVVEKENGVYCAVAWNLILGERKEEKQIRFSFPQMPEGDYMITRKTVDEEVCNPLKVWHMMGEPASLNEKQLELLKETSVPQTQVWQEKVSEEGLHISFCLEKQAVVYLEIERIIKTSDRGFNYDRIRRGV